MSNNRAVVNHDIELVSSDEELDVAEMALNPTVLPFGLVNLEANRFTISRERNEAMIRCNELNRQLLFLRSI